MLQPVADPRVLPLQVKILPAGVNETDVAGWAAGSVIAGRLYSRLTTAMVGGISRVSPAWTVRAEPPAGSGPVHACMHASAHAGRQAGWQAGGGGVAPPPLLR